MADEPRVIPPPSVDPTTLTTEALRREIRLLSEALDYRFDNLSAEINSRLDSAEKLMNEKFHSVEQRFTLLGEQRQEAHEATTTAVAAALQSQKEAVAKSEAATNKLKEIAKSPDESEEIRQLAANAVAQR